MVGVLRARVGGAWVDLGSVGPQGPQGAPADISLQPWNSAWGVVLMKRDLELPTTSGGGFQIPASGQLGITFAESYTFVEGRRYLFTYYCRAWGVGGGAATAASVRMLPYVDGADRQTFMNDPWTSKPALSWDTVRAEFVMNCVAGGTGNNLSPGSHSFQFVAIADATGTHTFWNNGSHFTIEDVGPISGAYPVAPPVASTTWLTLPITWPVAHNVSYRKVNDEVQFRGAMSWNITGVANPCVTMPADCRPPIPTRFQTWLLATSDQYSPVAGHQLGISVLTSGAMSIAGLDATQGFVAFDQVRYSVTL